MLLGLGFGQGKLGLETHEAEFAKIAGPVRPPLAMTGCRNVGIRPVMLEADGAKPVGEESPAAFLGKLVTNEMQLVAKSDAVILGRYAAVGEPDPNFLGFDDLGNLSDDGEFFGGKSGLHAV